MFTLDHCFLYFDMQLRCFYDHFGKKNVTKSEELNMCVFTIVQGVSCAWNLMFHRPQKTMLQLMLVLI